MPARMGGVRFVTTAAIVSTLSHATWVTLAILCLAYGSLLTACYLAVRGKPGAALFATYSLILAVWATAVADSGSISANDVVALVQALRSTVPR